MGYKCICFYDEKTEKEMRENWSLKIVNKLFKKLLISGVVFV